MSDFEGKLILIVFDCCHFLKFHQLALIFKIKKNHNETNDKMTLFRRSFGTKLKSLG